MNDNYRYYLTYSIKSKLAEFESKELPVLLTNEATRDAVLRIFSKTLRENPKIASMEQEQVSINALNHTVSQRAIESLGRALNPRPTAYKAQP